MTPMRRKLDYTLYLATDRGTRDVDSFCGLLAACIENGATIIQYREKNATAREMMETGRRILEVTRRYGVPLIINDRVDVMLALDADGVHVGPNDLPANVVRRLAGGKIVGCSANNRERLRAAEAADADYVGCGPVFATRTKLDTGGVLGAAGLRELASCAQLPVVGIGGIGPDNLTELEGTGVAGVCVISSVWHAPDPAAVVAQLRRCLRPGG